MQDNLKSHIVRQYVKKNNFRPAGESEDVIYYQLINEYIIKEKTYTLKQKITAEQAMILSLTESVDKGAL